MLQQQICPKTVKMLLSSYRWSCQQHLRTGIFYQSSTSSQGISENAIFFKAFVNHHEISCSELNSNCQRRNWLDAGEEWERNCERQKEATWRPDGIRPPVLYAKHTLWICSVTKQNTRYIVNYKCQFVLD